MDSMERRKNVAWKGWKENLWLVLASVFYAFELPPGLHLHSKITNESFREGIIPKSSRPFTLMSVSNVTSHWRVITDAKGLCTMCNHSHSTSSCKRSNNKPSAPCWLDWKAFQFMTIQSSKEPCRRQVSATRRLSWICQWLPGYIYNI